MYFVVNTLSVTTQRCSRKILLSRWMRIFFKKIHLTADLDLKVIWLTRWHHENGSRDLTKCSYTSCIDEDCYIKLTIIGSDNGLSPGRRQAIIWTNDGILSIRTFQTHFSEIVSEIHTFLFKKMHFKMSSGKWRPSCLGLNVIRDLVSQCKLIGFFVYDSWLWQFNAAFISCGC